MRYLTRERFDTGARLSGEGASASSLEKRYVSRVVLLRRRAVEVVRAGALALASVPLLFAGCREPTEITVTLRTDVACADVSETSLSVGSLTTLAGKPPVSTRKGCSDPSGRIGSLVIVPSGDNDDEVAIQVITTINGLPTSACDASKPSSDCIVARRALRFVPHTPLDLPIELSASCLGKVCSPEQTCLGGVCVAAKLPDPAACTTPGGCAVVGDAGPDVAVEAAADASQSDLVAWFDFEGTQGSTVLDLSGSGNHGTLLGASAQAGAGHNGSVGLVLTASDTLSVGPSPILAAIDQNSGVTVSAWVSVKANPTALGFIFDHDPTPGIDDLEAWLTPTHVCGDAVPSHQTPTCTPRPVALGAWFHVAMTANASTLALFVNGVFALSNGAPPPQFALTKTSYFGFDWAGTMDDLRIYNRVLSDTEIAALAK